MNTINSSTKITSPHEIKAASDLSTDINRISSSSTSFDSGSEDFEGINFSYVYALHTFVATLEGQVCVLREDELELLDGSNSYWWLIKRIKTGEIGYIPAENIEHPVEKLARLNKTKNIHRTSLYNFTQDKKHETENPETITQESDLETSYRLRKRVIKFNDKLEVYFSDSETNTVQIAYEDMVCEDLTPQLISIEDIQTSNEEVSEIKKGVFKKLMNRLSSKMNDVNKTTKSPNASKSYLADNNGSGGPIQHRILIGQQDTMSEQNSNMNYPSSVSSPTVTTPTSARPALNVLRIYAGNVDLKATFKTLPVKQEMTVNEVLTSALKKFRVENASPGEYYLSIVHLDSAEKRLADDEQLLQVIMNLRYKALPGMTHEHPNLYEAHSQDTKEDNIIKVLINKKLNLFEKNYHLIRIYLEEDSSSQSIRRYKTIGISSDRTIKDIIEIAIKKFHITNPQNYDFTICSVFKGQETKLEESETVLSILEAGFGSSEDVDFVFRKIRNSNAPSDVDPVTPEEHEGEPDVLFKKPAFLNDIGMSSSSPHSVNDTFLSPTSSVNILPSIPSLSPLSPQDNVKPDSPQITNRYMSFGMVESFVPPNPKAEKELPSTEKALSPINSFSSPRMSFSTLSVVTPSVHSITNVSKYDQPSSYEQQINDTGQNYATSSKGALKSSPQKTSPSKKHGPISIIDTRPDISSDKVIPQLPSDKAEPSPVLSPGLDISKAFDFMEQLIGESIREDTDSLRMAELKSNLSKSVTSIPSGSSTPSYSPSASLFRKNGSNDHQRHLSMESTGSNTGYHRGRADFFGASRKLSSLNGFTLLSSCQPDLSVKSMDSFDPQAHKKKTEAMIKQVENDLDSLAMVALENMKEKS